MKEKDKNKLLIAGAGAVALGTAFFFRYKILGLFSSIYQIEDAKTREVIESLDPRIQKRAINFVLDLQRQGIHYRLYEGIRTFQTQQEYYNQGRDIWGNVIDYSQVITNAEPGESYHQYGLAFDGVEIQNGKAIWNSPNQDKIVKAGERYGFYWGGNFGDDPHWEYRKFGTVFDLLAQYQAGQLTLPYAV